MGMLSKPVIYSKHYMFSPLLFANLVRIKLRNVVSSSGEGSFALLDVSQGG